MSLLLLEALGALLLLLLIVWWTMFSGRQHGELPPTPASTAEDGTSLPLDRPAADNLPRTVPPAEK